MKRANEAFTGKDNARKREHLFMGEGEKPLAPELYRGQHSVQPSEAPPRPAPAPPAPPAATDGVRDSRSRGSSRG